MREVRRVETGWCGEYIDPESQEGVPDFQPFHAAKSADGRWTVSYTFSGMPDGRLLRFTLIEELDDGAPPPAGDEPETSPPVLALAAARVISAER